MFATDLIGNIGNEKDLMIDVQNRFVNPDYLKDPTITMMGFKGLKPGVAGDIFRKGGSNMLFGDFIDSVEQGRLEFIHNKRW